jgi:hypothetical protein
MKEISVSCSFRVSRLLQQNLQADSILQLHQTYSLFEEWFSFGINMDLSTDKFLNWPPFYTYCSISLQPNTDTRQQQFKIWSEVILTHCKNSKLYVTTIDDFQQVTRNTSINRYLNEDFLRNLFEHMKNEGSCVFEGDTMLMFWKRKEALGEQVYKWVRFI